MATSYELTSETKVSFEKILQDMFENYTEIAINLKDDMNRIFKLARYEAFGKFVNSIFEVYNNEICSRAVPNILNNWHDSEASFMAFAKKIGVGDEAEKFSLDVEQFITDCAENVLPRLDLIDVVDTSKAVMSEEHLKEINNNLTKIVNKTVELTQDYERQIDSYIEENSAVASLKPIFLVIPILFSVFIDKLGEKLHEFCEDFKNNLTAFEVNADEYSKNIVSRVTMPTGVSSSSLGQNENGGIVIPSFEAALATVGSVLSPNAANRSRRRTLGLNSSNNAGRSTEKVSKPKAHKKLREFALKLLDNPKDFGIFIAFTRYIDNIVCNEATRKVKELPYELIDKLMPIFDDFYTELGVNLIPKFDDFDKRKEFAEREYLGVLKERENIEYFTSEADKDTFISHYSRNFFIFNTVARMVQNICNQRMKDSKLPNDINLVYALYVLTCPIVDNDTHINVDYLWEYSKFSYRTASYIFKIIGEDFDIAYNNHIEKGSNIKLQVSDREVQDSNESIIKLEAYLKEHSEKIERLHQKYAKNLAEIISNSNKNIKSTGGISNDKKTGSKSSSVSAYPVDERLISLIGNNVEHVKAVKNDVAERMKLQQDKTKDSVDTLLGLFSGVLSIIGAISPFASVLSVTVNKATKIDLSKSFSGFSQVIKVPRIYKFLSKKVWDDLSGYYNCRDKDIVAHTIQYQRFKLFNELPEQSQRLYPAITDLLFEKKENQMFDEDLTSDTKENLDNALLTSVYFFNNYINFSKIQDNFVSNGIGIKLIKLALLYQKYPESKIDKLIKKIVDNCVQKYNWAKPNMNVNIGDFLM